METKGNVMESRVWVGSILGSVCLGGDGTTSGH